VQVIKLLNLSQHQNVYLRKDGQHRSVLPICRVEGSVRQTIPRVVKGRIADLQQTYDDQCDLFVLVVVKEDRLGCAAWLQGSGFDFEVISAEQVNVG